MTRCAKSSPHDPRRTPPPGERPGSPGTEPRPVQRKRREERQGVKKRDSLPVRMEAESDFVARALGPLALVNPILDQMQIRRIVNLHCPGDVRLDRPVGDVIHLLVANRLSSPQPLLHVAEWAESSGAEFVLGTPALKFSYHYDPKRAETDAKYDGLYAVSTSLRKKTHSTDDVFTTFKEQHHIETAHHQWKAPIRLRPLFLKRVTRLESLIFVQFLALMAFYLLQRLYRLAKGQGSSASPTLRLWSVTTPTASGSCRCH